MRAIDIHSHIGNILYKSGGELIFRTGIKFPRSTGVQRLDEKNLFRTSRRARILDTYLPGWSLANERKRNTAATLENMRASFDTGTGVRIEKCVCLPVAPYTDYRDMCAAARAEPRITAFTSPDFSDAGNMPGKLEADLKNGAAGVKIHPIIQETTADSQEVMQAAETAAAYGAPVLLHSGRASYYPAREQKDRFTENASIIKIERLIAARPDTRFIVGHAGLGEITAVLELLPKYKNVWVDTSFQPPEAIRTLAGAFGGGRVMFASDWPYGLRRPAVLAVCEACKGDAGLLEAVLYGNAAELLELGATA